ncbi:AP2/ERF family transcription factor [Skeletonema marinoi]|uniref:AP2/ERF family transcription factor n=1 Tax=Skeletonema marinoi TaxID=267567 RepID=A0AAD9DEB4_9STRA|nr:AP2/ERF family transcription factor [Skeletonema marinoi]
MDGEESDSEDSEGEIQLCSFRGCISNASTDEGLCDMHSAHDNNYCFSEEAGQKRALPLGDSIDDKDVKKRQKMKMNAFTIDLSDVPPQSPIPKRKCYMKEGASKYTGVSFFQQRNEWAAQIMIESKRHIIGYYESEEEAAVDYARALFKYKGGVYQQSFEVDLTDAPPQPPILKREGRIKDGTSKYLGVSFDITNNKWQTHINIGGKKRRVGVYENEEDAAVDFARAVLKYKGQGALEKAREQRLQNSFVVDLSGASKYTGVTFHKQGNGWRAQITIDGAARYIGYYKSEEEAAVDYARAVFKYKGKGALERAMEQTRIQSSLVAGLSDVPPQSPIPKRRGRIKEGSSKYTGVTFHKQVNKWAAQITLEGKHRHIGV